MAGGTTFHFVTDGIHSALEQARAAANGLDVRVGGGVATVREYLRARLVDEMHLAVGPVLLGSGENLFHGLDLHGARLRVREDDRGRACDARDPAQARVTKRVRSRWRDVAAGAVLAFATGLAPGASRRRIPTARSRSSIRRRPGEATRR